MADILVDDEAAGTDEEFWFDERAADRAVAFFPRFLTHREGRWAGKPFELLPWQEQIVRDLFGWKRRDGSRKYRVAWLEVARGNGKTPFAAGLMILLLFGTGEQGGQIYCVAGDKDQAMVVFQDALHSIRANPALERDVECFKQVIYHHGLGSRIEAVTSAPGTKHGLRPSGVVGDEVHVWKKRELYDVFHTAAGKRECLEIYITTAGYDRTSVAYELHEYACQVRDGVIDDPSFYPVIFAADETDDWTDPATWEKANPSIDITISREWLAAECEKAQRMPAQENVFKQLHLNLWTEQHSRWLSLAQWDKNEREVDPEELRGRLCFGGLDLAKTKDLSSLALLFPPLPGEDPADWQVLWRHWCPADDIRERVRRDHVPYDAWARQGFLHPTEGNTTDYNFIERDIIELATIYDIKEIAFDRFFAGPIVQNLMGEGLRMVEFAQSCAVMGAPTAELERLVLAELLRHGGDPIARWAAANAVVRKDSNGNLKPDKQRSQERIDPMVALVMAIGLGLVAEIEPESIYEERGVIFL